MTEDEKYVREHVDCVVHEHCIVLSGTGMQARTWPIAADLVRTRLEQIRQQTKDAEFVAKMLSSPEHDVQFMALMFDGPHSEESQQWYIHRLCCTSRILARETEALDALKRGMK